MQENCYIPTQKNNWIKSPKETTDRESSVAHFDRSGWSHWAHGLSLPLMSPVLIIKTKRKPPTAKITVLLLSFAYVMAFLATASSSCSRRLGSPQLPHPLPSISRCTPSFPLVSFPNSISLHAHRAGARVVGVVAAAAAAGKSSSNAIQNDKNVKKAEEEEETIEVEEELPWIQEKALDLVEFTGSVTQAIPGPRVGQSSLPWILALPLAYAGITFVIAFVKTVKKFGSPRYKRKKLVNKNAMLCKSIDGLFQKGEGKVGADASSQQHVALEGMEKRTGFTMVDIVRKYIRYALNEKPFNPELVASLIQFRKASMLDDSQVAEILNDISRRIVREKGPVVMNMSGYSEKGFKRKLAVQALFGKVFYLSELPEFCSRDSSLIVKEIFGVADEDADKLRLHTLSEAGNMDSLEKMVDDSDSEDSNGKTSDGSDSEYSNEKTSNAP